MATAEAWACPVCRDERGDVAYAMPCNHQFCLGCIQRWARMRDSCPLCRTPMHTVKVSVRGDDQYIECIVSPPAVPAPAGFGTVTDPEEAEAPDQAPPPPPPGQEDREQDIRAALGGLLPEEWAGVFREQRDILAPLLPWLRERLSAIPNIHWWQIRSLEGLFICSLCQLGLDRNALIQRVYPIMGLITIVLIQRLITVTISLCGQQARQLLGLEEDSASEQEEGPAATSSPTTSPQRTLVPSSSVGPNVEEPPSTSSELPAAPSPREQEQPNLHPGQEAAGPSAQGCSPSAPSRGRKRSAGGPRRPKKRRASSAQRAPQPRKRPPSRRL
ncbi:TOPRS ligase, partial [Penelope pileata]|nr:TOPRS ligase [Penelope pileata]